MNMDLIKGFLHFNDDSDQGAFEVIKTAKVGGYEGFPSKAYPQMPAKVDLYWEGPDPSDRNNFSAGRKTIKGVDKNVTMWLGVSPPPKDPQYTIDLNDFKVRYGTDTESVNWEEDYKKSAELAEMIHDNTDKDPIPWSPGCIWAGYLVQLFFKNAIDNAKFVKISMYEPGLDATSPCPIDKGNGWGEDCNGTFSVNDPWSDQGMFDYKWLRRWTPIVHAYLNKYITSSKQKGILQFLHGVNHSQKDEPNWMPEILKSDWNTLSTEEKNRIFVRVFNADNDPNCHGVGKCKSHQKLYFSDRDILISSGQTSRGYYLSTWFTNDDILFQNSFSFCDYWSNLFELMWTRSAHPFQSQTEFTGDHIQTCSPEGTVDNKGFCTNPKITRI